MVFTGERCSTLPRNFETYAVTQEVELPDLPDVGDTALGPELHGFDLDVVTIGFTFVSSDFEVKLLIVRVYGESVDIEDFKTQVLLTANGQVLNATQAEALFEQLFPGQRGSMSFDKMFKRRVM